MGKQKVLIFTDCYIYGGSERLMTFLLANEKLNKEFDLSLSYRKHKAYTTGLDTDVKRLNIGAALFPLRLLSNYTLFYKINCSKLPSPFKFILKLLFALLEGLGLYMIFNVVVLYFFLRRIRPDVIHVNNGGYPGANTCNHFVLAASLNKINAVVYQVNNLASPARNIFHRILDHLVNKRVKYFITASANAKDALSAGRGFAVEKIRQIPNTVKIEAIKQSRNSLLKEVNWPEDSFLLVQVAFLTNRKGQINLLKAVKEIKRSAQNGIAEKLKLILVGDGEDEPLLKQYVTENRLEADVFFAGYRANSVDFIESADVFLLPSVANEDMPLALLAAMFLAKPIIATRLAGISEAVVNKESGILIERGPGTFVQELKVAITEMYGRPDLREQYGQQARVKFDQHYSEEAYGQHLTNLYVLAQRIA